VNARCLAGCLCLAAVIVAPLDGRDIRVELFSGKTITALTLEAGSGSVRICGPPRCNRCFEVKAGAKARCVALRASVRCTSGEKVSEFQTASFLAPEPFRLTVATSRRENESAAAVLRRAEAAPTARGLRVIALVGLEDYVAGVLAGEAATLRNPEALAAMAMVARTWAERSRGRHQAEGFDFCSLTHCQFFRMPAGEASASLVAAEAAKRTAGRVLEFRGKLIDAYYSACCGGVTEAAGDVWPDRRAPYLQAVNDPYCARSEQFHWQRTLALGDIEKVLRETGEKSFPGSLHDVVVESRTVSGRARTLRLVGSGARKIDANEFRYALNRALGWNTLKSNLYTVERRGDALIFTGRGLGHGVGLCQAGAEQMGQMGIGFERILAHYFPGTTLGSLSGQEDTRFLSSEHFEIVFPSRQEHLAAAALETLEAQRTKLGARADALPTRIRVRSWATTVDFIHAVRQPGWVAGTNDGRVIDLQPLDLLKRKGILESTLRHEMTHLVVRRLRAAGVPHWYEEGLVLFLTGEVVKGESRALDPRRGLELSLTGPRSEREMRAAYAQALEHVRELAGRKGEAVLWRVLERPSPQDLQWFKSVR
jgi:stage II sporulation protein D